MVMLTRASGAVPFRLTMRLMFGEAAVTPKEKDVSVFARVATASGKKKTSLKTHTDNFTFSFHRGVGVKTVYRRL